MRKQNETPGIRWKPLRLREARSLPGNPWRGMYAIFPFVITGGGTQAPLPPVRSDHTLCLIELNLAAFRNAELSDGALAEIDRIFAYYEANRQEMIVRFLYDLDGNGLQNEPEELAVILAHIRQAGSLLRRYSRSIFTLQGLFVGSWGEMHTSRHLDAHTMTRLTTALDEAAGGTLLMSVRCPSQWREIFQAFDPPLGSRLFDDSLRSRVGLFNDAILSSETDFGTYAQSSRAQAFNWGVKRSREEELDFQRRLCAGVPNGGELVQGDHAFPLPEVYRTFGLMRLSYLNEEFDRKALDRLKAERNIARGRSFRGASAYEYLTGHLGYRYTVCRTLLEPDEDGVAVQVQLKNAGFAPCYFPLQAALRLQAGAESPGAAYPMSGDIRRIAPGEKHWLTAHIPGGHIPAGEYAVGIEVSDPRSGKPVYLASIVKDGTPATALRLGTMKVQR